MKVDRFKKFGYGSNKRCCPKTNSANGETPVQGGLSYTPAQMMKLVQNGIPVNAPNAQLVESQGVPNPSWDIPLERKRGVDIADIWQKEKATRLKIAKAYKDAKQKAADVAASE